MPVAGDRHLFVMGLGQSGRMLGSTIPLSDARGGMAEAPRPNILMIEDDADAAAYLSQRLGSVGWQVEHTTDGEAGFQKAIGQRFDVILVDRMLPSRDGLELVKALRRMGDATPVLFMTAMGAVSDRVAGLKGGGDDYLVKPFSFEELDARLHALAKRGRGAAAERVVLRVRDLEINRIERSVRRAGVDIDLLPLEYKLLEFLALRAGQIVTRKMLLESVWGFQFDPQTNIVETHISRLRTKIDRPAQTALITTVRGAGYVVAEH
jgi:two-component system OmpR family response regulator